MKDTHIKSFDKVGIFPPKGIRHSAEAVVLNVSEVFDLDHVKDQKIIGSMFVLSERIISNFFDLGVIAFKESPKLENFARRYFGFTNGQDKYKREAYIINELSIFSKKHNLGKDLEYEVYCWLEFYSTEVFTNVTRYKHCDRFKAVIDLIA